MVSYRGTQRTAILNCKVAGPVLRSVFSAWRLRLRRGEAVARRTNERRFFDGIKRASQFVTRFVWMHINKGKRCGRNSTSCRWHGWLAVNYCFTLPCLRFPRALYLTFRLARVVRRQYGNPLILWRRVYSVCLKMRFYCCIQRRVSDKDTTATVLGRFVSAALTTPWNFSREIFTFLASFYWNWMSPSGNQRWKRGMSGCFL